MKIRFLNTYVDNYTMDEALLEMSNLIKENRNAYVVTPNVDHIVRIEYDKSFKKIYDDADLVLTDGMPLVWLSKLMDFSIVEKVSGSDLFPKLCALAKIKKYKMFFLGAGDGVAEKAAKNLIKGNEGLQVVGTYSPSMGFEYDYEEISKIIEMIKDTSPDILIVALGSPKQEQFIYQYRKMLKVPLLLGLGASLDFAAGKVKRAPKWMSSIGLEWFYRFVKEPRRLFKRYFIDDIKILLLIWKYREQFKFFLF